MKKFLSLVLALVMALSLTTVAWGADSVASKTELQNAITAAQAGDTITLTGSFETDALITINKAITLDLNGYSITRNGIDYGYCVLYITATGVTVTDSADTNGAGIVNNGTKGMAIYMASGAGLTLTDVNVTGPNQGVLVLASNGNLTLDSGAVVTGTATEEQGGDGIRAYNATVTVNSGAKIVAGAVGAGIESYGTTTVTMNGEITSGWVGVTVFGGTVTINGDVTADTAIVLSDSDAADTIDGIDYANTGTAAVTGGHIDAATFVDMQTATASSHTATISGGTFSSAVPAEYCATGYVPVVKDGTFTVGTAPTTSGTTGNNSFSSSTTSGVTTSISAAEKYAIYEAASTTKVAPWTVKAYTTMATKTVTSNGVTTTSYIPAYYGVDTNDDGVVDIKLYEADANSGLFRIFKGDQFVTYVNPLGNALTTGGYVDGDYISNSAAYIAKDKGCGTYGEDVYKINNAKAYAVDPMGRFVAVINGKVAVYDGARLSVPHTFTDEVTYKSTTDLTVVAIECDVCEKVFQVVKTSKLPATYKGATANLTFGGNNYYILLETAVTSGTGTVGGTSTDKVTSAETFDAGIAMYVGMSVMAAASSAVVLKKKD